MKKNEVIKKIGLIMMNIIGIIIILGFTIFPTIVGWLLLGAFMVAKLFCFSKKKKSLDVLFGGFLVGIVVGVSFSAYVMQYRNDNAKADCKKEEQNGVYVCTSKSSKRYHNNEKCRGLKRCSATIKYISLEEAIQMNRTPCGYCMN